MLFWKRSWIDDRSKSQLSSLIGGFYLRGKIGWRKTNLLFCRLCVIIAPSSTVTTSNLMGSKLRKLSRKHIIDIVVTRNGTWSPDML